MDDTAPPGLRFRIANAADRPRLVEMINTAFAIETFMDGTRTDEERLTAMMEKGEIVVAEEAGGAMVASVYLEQRGRRGYLGMLAVDPAYQGRQLGTQMLKEAERRFREQGCEAIDITVLSLRPELVPVYRRFGFVETGTEPFNPPRRFLNDVKCHCIVMSKGL